MSTFSMPDTLMPDAKTMEANLKQMQDQMMAMMPGELASTANLMAHPMAAVAAGSALGLAMASHAFGLWAGAVAGSVEASQRAFGLNDWPEPVESFREPRAAAARAKAATETLVSDMERTARDAVEVAAKAADATIRDAAKAMEGISRPLTFTDRIRTQKPKMPDDLKAIAGIGPKLEQVLNDLGIWTYVQVAALGAEQVAWLEEHLGFKGRIERDDWIAQAAKLSGASR